MCGKSRKEISINFDGGNVGGGHIAREVGEGGTGASRGRGEVAGVDLFNSSEPYKKRNSIFWWEAWRPKDLGLGTQF